MRATREGETGLVDLLDRVLNKGLVLNADMIITVSGIPLLGLNLKAVLASVDTMIAHGMWSNWDKALRAIAIEEERRRVLEATRFLKGETPLFRSLCSCWQNAGIIQTWRPGTLYITERRVVVNRRELLEILFESEFENLQSFSIEDAETVAGKATRYIHLLHHDGAVISLHLLDPMGLIKVIGKEMERRNLPWVEHEVHPRKDTIDVSSHRCDPVIPSEKMRRRERNAQVYSKG